MHLLLRLVATATTLITAGLSPGVVLADSHRQDQICNGRMDSSCSAWRGIVAPIPCQIADDTDPIKSSESLACVIHRLRLVTAGWVWSVGRLPLVLAVKYAGVETSPIRMIPSETETSRPKPNNAQQRNGRPSTSVPWKSRSRIRVQEYSRPAGKSWGCGWLVCGATAASKR